MFGTFRVLTMRKYKATTFIDTFSSKDFSRVQLMLANSLPRMYEIALGDILEVKYEETTSRSGAQVLEVNYIGEIIHSKNQLLYKSKQSAKLDDIRKECLYNSINGGRHLLIWKFKYEFTRAIRDLLSSHGFVDVITPIVMEDRGTSTVQPMKVVSNFGGEGYLKITHELELKKIYYITLTPVFEIGELTRDVYSTQFGVNEFLSLEYVAPVGHTNMLELIKSIISLAKSIAERLHLDYNEDFAKLEIKDLECSETECGDSASTVYLKLVTDSPLVKTASTGSKTEFKWKYGLKTIAHGYIDENQPDIISELFAQQQKSLKEKGIKAKTDKKYLEILGYSSPSSESFNLGIDRFIQFFLNLDTAYHVHNILGI